MTVFADLLETAAPARRPDEPTRRRAPWARSWTAQAQPAQIAGLLMALALKGERPARDGRLRAGDARARDAAAAAGGRRVRHVRHRRRRRAHVQRLDGGGARRSPAPACASPSTATARCRAAAAAPTCSRRSASSSRRPPIASSTALEQASIAFFFAPAWHPSMRHAGPTRKELGVRTAFNLLGPLTNPAGAQRSSSASRGPSTPSWSRERSGALGAERAWVVHGAGGLDELSTLGHTKVSELARRHGATRSTCIRPTSDCRRRRVADLAGGTAAENAAMIERCSTASSGAAPRHRAAQCRRRAADRRRGVVARRRAWQLAATSLDSGRARAALTTLREVCGDDDRRVCSTATVGGRGADPRDERARRRPRAERRAPQAGACGARGGARVSSTRCARRASA